MKRKHAQRWPVDRNRLATALAKHGFHTFAEVGLKAGYTETWLSTMLSRGGITQPMVSFLELHGITMDDIKPLEPPKEKPVARAPRNTIGDMDRDLFFREMYKTMFAAMRDALNAESVKS